VKRLVGAVVLVVLIALAGCTTAVEKTDDAQIQFETVSNETGFSYEGRDTSWFRNGNAGVYVLDYDRDGWQDVLAIGGERPALMENDGGTFERSGALPAIDDRVKSATVVDFDDDGTDDVILFRPYDSPIAIRNTLDGFERTDIGLGNLSYPAGGAVADYDGDGDEDLFVYQTGDWKRHQPAGYSSVTLQVANDNGNPNYLYENVNGTYRRVATDTFEGERWSLAASFVDLNDDGRPDVHIAEDYNNDTIYLNQGDDGFTQRFLNQNTARNGMTSEIADVNGDGRLDIFVSNIGIPFQTANVSDGRQRLYENLLGHLMHSSRMKGNNLLLNQGDGTFVDRASAYGVRVGGWGWAASLVDFDNDGQRDLIHATQNVAELHPDDPIYTYPMLFERTGDTFTRLDASDRGLREVDGRGLATFDYDRDGDQDILAGRIRGDFLLYENVVSTDPNSLELRVTDGANGTVYGATVIVDGQRKRTLVQHHATGFLSMDTRIKHVGLGSTAEVDLRVTWPDGTERTFEGVKANQRLRVTRDGLETVTTFEAD